MGEASYMRRYYRVEDEEGGYVYLLDEHLGLGRGLVSESLKNMIVDECLNVSFRKAAASVSVMTNQCISHAGAWNILQERGAQVAAHEERAVEFNERHGLRGGLETKVLFEEMDGVWLSMQGKDRPDKIGKREMKVATHYSGWEETSKGRYETVGKVAYTGFDGAKDFHKKREAQIARYYNTDEIITRILNGDGADWITSTDEDVILQLDRFHRSRAILRGLADKTARAHINRLFKEKDVDGALSCIAKLLELADNDEKKRIGTLYKYFSNNKENLLNWDERGVVLPQPPEGIVYRNLGVQENSNCTLITHRMKRRRASWSIKGAGHMAKLLCLRSTQNSLRKLTRTVLTEIVSDRVGEPLSVAQTPKYDGHGYSGGVSHGGWPFENVANTYGRQAIKNIFRPKKL
jgi:hypothetical protein